MILIGFIITAVFISPVYLIKNILEANKLGLFNTIKYQEFLEIYLDENSNKELATNADYFNFNLGLLEDHPNSIGGLIRVDYQVKEFENIINFSENENLNIDQDLINSIQGDLDIYNSQYKSTLELAKNKRFKTYLVLSLILSLILTYIFYPYYKEYREDDELILK